MLCKHAVARISGYATYNEYTIRSKALASEKPGKKFCKKVLMNYTGSL
jgi:hypothetical protein